MAEYNPGKAYKSKWNAESGNTEKYMVFASARFHLMEPTSEIHNCRKAVFFLCGDITLKHHLYTIISNYNQG